MPIRQSFDEALIELRDLLKVMGEKAISLFDQSMISLKEQDLHLADKVIMADPEINMLEEKINDIVVAIITKQQPVAADLRKVLSALKISAELERIGDTASNISKSVKFIGEEPFVKPLVHIPKMADICKEMFEEAMVAYLNEDVQSAFEIAKRDQEVNNLFKTIVEELLTIMSENEKSLRQMIQLEFIARHLERIGDHITNITEHTVYQVKAERVKLDQ